MSLRSQLHRYFESDDASRTKSAKIIWTLRVRFENDLHVTSRDALHIWRVFDCAHIGLGQHKSKEWLIFAKRCREVQDLRWRMQPENFGPIALRLKMDQPG